VAGYIREVSNVSDEARMLLGCARILEENAMDAWMKETEPVESILETLKSVVRPKFVEAKIVAMLEGDRRTYREANAGIDNIKYTAGSIVEDLIFTAMDHEKAGLGPVFHPPKLRLVQR
jgi:hypothetical protein